MDVTKHNFLAALPQMLRAIAEGQIIAIDLEMSGIGDGLRRDASKPSLQAHYDEARKAASRYTILQMGITILKPDEARGIYEATGIYNVTIDPLVSQANKIGVERDVTLSSGSVHFLQSHGFDLGACLTNGVSFLSRQESSKALDDHDKRQERFAIPTAQFLADISAYDHETIGFVRGATHEIENWIRDVTTGATIDRCVNIDITGGAQARYHRKLIHELLRCKFVDYRGYQENGATFMTIVKIDPEREANVAAGRKMVLKSALDKETGFRWVIEALFGGDISAISASWFAADYDGDSKWMDTDKINRDFAEISEKIKANHKSRVLVGHNLFLDLAFLYQTFVGDLPANVIDFQAAIHALLPNVLDTKFVATSIDHVGYQDGSSLAELSTKYKSFTEPAIEVPEKFAGYVDKVKLHEAGFDSWICAEACLRLAYQMQKKDGSATETSLILDIAHPWYDKYLNKLRVFRCEETFCDLSPRQQQQVGRPAAHHHFRGPSQDVRNYEQPPQQPPQAYYGEHPAQVGSVAGPLGPGFHSHLQGYPGGYEYPGGGKRGGYDGGRGGYQGN